ncbi:MAG: hypothetical protein HQK65_07560 [Desulfamplus sp.]|nr:hypothetical protein [Desulfamplus sp.]
MDKMTPTHEALEVIRQTIKNLELQYQALAATLPKTTKDKTKKAGQRVLVHPLTGQKRVY